MSNISFIVPVYNQEKDIENFLNTICAVNIPDIEIICIDDGSTDKTSVLLDRAVEKDNRIKAYHIGNRGPGYARNYGISKACSKYIAFCDSDDRIYTDVYEKMYDTIESEGKDLVLTNFREVFDSGKIVNRTYSFSEENDHWGLLSQIALYAKIFSLDFIKRNNITFPDFYQGEDRVFLGKVVVAKPDFIWMDEISYDYLRHENSEIETLTHTYSFNHFEQRIDCWKEFYHICINVFPEETEIHILQGMSFIYKMWTKLPLETKGKALEKVRELLRLSDHEGHLNWNIFGLPLHQLLETSSFEEYAKAVNERSTKSVINEHKKTDQPVVTIIIPMYNVGKYLRQCLQSLVSQTFEDFEIICVDDGSEDNTIEIVQEFMTFDKRISLLQQNHGMAGVARNYGMTKARGEYYLFLDGDDFFEPQMLEMSVKKIKEDDADICMFDAQLYYENTKETKRVATYLKHDFLPEEIPFEGKSYKYIFNLSTASPWNKLIKKSLVDEYNIQFMPLPRCNDVYFIFMTMAVARRITILEDVFVNYRQSDTSLQANNDKSPYNWYAALVQLKSKLEELGIFKDVEQSFMNYALSLSIYNLFSLKDVNVFCEFYNKAKAEMFGNLGLPDYDPAEFYSVNKDKYEKFCAVLEYTPEEYMYNEIKKLKEEKFWWMKRAKTAENKLKKSEKKVKSIKRSETFRVGKAILYIPRKILRLIPRKYLRKMKKLILRK